MRTSCPARRRRSSAVVALSFVGVVSVPHVLAAQAAAQTTRSDTVVTACASPPQRAFDFWLGRWDVADATGKVVGENQITRVLGGCALHEDWRGGDGTRGNSYSMYDNATKAWHQQWIDIGGNLLRLSGSIDSGTIVLNGENVTPAGRAHSRVTWSRLPGDRVRQHWQMSTDGGTSWRTHFDGYYRRKVASPGASQPVAAVADVHTIDAIIAALYRSISGAKGVERDWARFRGLFTLDARLTSTWRRADGTWTSATWTPDGYIAMVSESLMREGFFEREVARKTERFGNIAHLFSTYESRDNADDPAPFQRGINSIQLRHDGQRWAIATILWEAESATHAIPDQYQSRVAIGAPSQSELLALVAPGPEHERLSALAGGWSVETVAPSGAATKSHTAQATTIIGGRFLQIDLTATGPRPAPQRFTIGFDRRHGRYNLIAMDTDGTYSVSATGTERDGVIRMVGEDEDPVMRRMGLTKRFAHTLEILSRDEFTLSVLFVDTRTPEERLVPAARYRFRRIP